MGALKGTEGSVKIKNSYSPCKVAHEWHNILLGHIQSVVEELHSQSTLTNALITVAQSLLQKESRCPKWRRLHLHFSQNSKFTFFIFKIFRTRLILVKFNCIYQMTTEHITTVLVFTRNEGSAFIHQQKPMNCVKQLVYFVMTCQLVVNQHC